MLADKILLIKLFPKVYSQSQSKVNISLPGNLLRLVVIMKKQVVIWEYGFKAEQNDKTGEDEEEDAEEEEDEEEEDD